MVPEGFTVDLTLCFAFSFLSFKMHVSKRGTVVAFGVLVVILLLTGNLFATDNDDNFSKRTSWRTKILA